jgi:hypothetical protein
MMFHKNDLLDRSIKMKCSKKWRFLGVTLSLFILLLPSCTPTVAVIKTGQTTCYSADGNLISCVGTGQDGEYQTGAAWPTPRFTANVDNNGDGDCTDTGERCNGTVTDNLTGLIWLRNANCVGKIESRDSWATALGYVVQLNTSGTMNGNDCGDTSNKGSHQTNWRLPNIRELHSLIDYAYFSPALSNGAGDAKWTEDDVFSNVQLSSYWSSSTATLDITTQAGTAWFVSFNYGGIFIGGKENRYSVWPVRGGQSKVIRRDGLVHDKKKILNP